MDWKYLCVPVQAILSGNYGWCNWGVIRNYLLGMQKQRLLPSGSVTANSRSPHV